jgi:hypothetical protein
MGALYMLQNGGRVVTLVFGGGLFQVVSVELWVGMMVHTGTDVVLPRDDGGFRHEWRMKKLP